MSTDHVRHPVEMISVGLVNDALGRETKNTDVAFFPITRFNLRMRADKHVRWSHLEGRHLVESSEYDEYWRRRLEIFERVCIPSVLSLTPRPDAWFIGFGDARPRYIQELLERLKNYPWIRPYFRDKKQLDSDKPLVELLSDQARLLGKSMVCSTRFDSDDSLNRQFIGALDRAISLLRERGFADDIRCIDFPYGLMQSAGALSVYLRRTNMFESIFEHVDRVKGPYRGGHDEIRNLMPLVEVVTNLPMWIYHRHEDTLEPAWVTARDRLPLTDPESHYPMFGLPSGTAQFLEARSSKLRPVDAGTRPAAKVDPRLQAPDLHAAPYWRADQLATAIELATSQNQPRLANWLASPGSNEAGGAAGVLREIDSANAFFLNAPLYGRLARQLLEEGEIAGALRAYDYAVLQAPTDRHLRAARDELATSLQSEIDLDEQMELVGVAPSQSEQTDTVVIVVSASSMESGGDERERLHERSRWMTAHGLRPHVVVLPQPSDSEQSAPVSRDGVAYEILPSPELPVGGEDASRRTMTRQLAERVSALQPCLMATDSTLTAQVMAASIGRAFAIPVDFGFDVASVDDEMSGESK